MISLMIGEVDYISSLLSKRLNIKFKVDDYSCNFGLLLNYAQNIYVTQEVSIKDGDALIYAGVIDEIQYEDYSDEEQKVITSVSCSAFNRYASRRTVNMFVADEKKVGVVVRQYLTTVLAEEGITEGKIDVGVTIEDLDAFDMWTKNIAQLYDALKDLDGSTWLIDMDKKLYFQKTIKIPIVYDITVKRGADIDVRNIEVKRSLENYRNKQFFVAGEPDTDEILPGEEGWVEYDGYLVTINNDDRLQVVRQIDAEIVKCRNLNGGSGVWGNVAEDSKVVTIADAIKACDVLLEKYGHEEVTVDFDTFDSRFMPGNFVYIEYPEFGIETGTSFVIDTVEISDLSKQTLNYHLSCTQRDVASTNTRAINFIDYQKKMLQKAVANLLNVVFS